MSVLDDIVDQWEIAERESPKMFGCLYIFCCVVMVAPLVWAAWNWLRP